MTIKLKPTGNRVLIEPITPPAMARGLHVPQDAIDKPTEGVVIVFGPKAEEIKVGDRVVYDRYHGEDIKIGEKMFKLFPSTELLAVIE